jgi:hypothetical protein
LQIPQNLVDGRMMLDTSYYLGFAFALQADQNVDIEYVLQALCPSHGLVTLFGETFFDCNGLHIVRKSAIHSENFPRYLFCIDGVILNRFQITGYCER